MADYRARMKEDAERRRNLEGNTMFQDLGEPIQKLLQTVSKDITDQELQLFSKVSVRLLAKVYDMLSSQEDPDKILAWLQEQVRKQNKENKDPSFHERVAKDPIAFYKELEKRNQEMLESFSKAESEREALRKANIAERDRRRKEADEKREADRQRALKNGETTDAVDRMKKEDVTDITNAFDRFASKQSTIDNSNSVQDTEWWKKDEYRRDYEKNKKKGKAWTRVVEGGSQAIPDSEMQAREEWYKSFCWWKSDKFRRDWLASREAEWWKEETYIRDWQDKGDKGTSWLAADETTGFNKKGHRRPAAKAELERRIQWYKDNGPKGIVKMWCALSEGSPDRCTLEEKRERDDYYKNGDWWKADGYVRKALDGVSGVDGIRKAGAAACDSEWWKSDEYRKDFKRGGKKWLLASEKAAALGDLDAEATEAEMQRREEWFSNNWWKAEEYVADFHANGENGTLWRAANEGASGGGKGSLCSAAEARSREEWFRSADDRDWWKDEAILRDWELNGRAGKKWTAAWREAALDSTGDKNRASEEELTKREQYFDKNWWKANKYVKDFQGNGGRGTAWKASDRKGHEDKDWWKGDSMQKQWLASRQGSLEQFWQRPDVIEDYWKNAAMGKRWTAANGAAAEAEIGDKVRASAEELAKREGFYQDNWWRAPDFQRDFAANGKFGKLWQAANPDGSGGEATKDELKRRREFFRLTGKGKHTPGFNAMLESDAVDARSGSKFTKFNRLQKRDEHFTKNWWKVNPDVRADFEAYGDKATLFKAATLEAASAGLSDNARYQASPEEIAERLAYFQSGEREDTTGDNWWKDAACAKEWAANREVPFWQNKEFIADFNENGFSGKEWTSKTAADGSLSLGSAGNHKKIALRQFADKLGVPVAELLAANPSIKDPNAFLALGSVVSNPKRNGDKTVEQLAAQLGVSVKDLLAANSAFRNDGKKTVKGDQSIHIPVTSGTEDKTGDSLDQIASKLGVASAELLAANSWITDAKALLPVGAVVSVPKRPEDLTVDQLASMLGQSSVDLLAENPEFRSGKEVVPKGQTLNVTVTPQKNGDSLAEIAAKLGVDVAELHAANSWVKDVNASLPVGANVAVPSRGEDLTADQLAAKLGVPVATLLAANSFLQSRWDIVKKDQPVHMSVCPHAPCDSLQEIASKLGVAVAELHAANSWVKDVNAPLPFGSKVANPKRNGDLTASVLASQLGVPLSDLLAANPTIKSGDDVVPKGLSLTLPISPEQNGDSLAEIAAKLGVTVADLHASNSWVKDVNAPLPFGSKVASAKRQWDVPAKVLASQLGVPLSSLLAANPTIKSGDDVVPKGLSLTLPISPEQNGDSLAEIAAKLGVAVAELHAANSWVKDVNAPLPFGSKVASAKRSGDLTADQLSSKLGVPLSDLLAANPTIKSGDDVVPKDQSVTAPVVPKSDSDSLAEIASKLGVAVAELHAANSWVKDVNAPLPFGSKVANPKRNGDLTASVLASQLGVPLSDLLAANPTIKSGDDVVPKGQSLTAPVVPKNDDSLAAIASKLGVTVAELHASNSWVKDVNAPLPFGSKVASAKRQWDVPAKVLASQLGVPLSDLLAANPTIKSGDDVVPKDQKITVPVVPKNSGDSLQEIASKLGVTVAELHASNSWVKDVNAPLPVGANVANPKRGDDLTAGQLATLLGVPVANVLAANPNLQNAEGMLRKDLHLNVPVIDGTKHRAADEELAARADWLKKNFWKAPKYTEDFENNGEKGTLWTMSEPNGKGEPVSEKELSARQAWFRPSQNWQLAEKPSEEEKGFPCDMVEAIDRDEWFKKNWWKNSDVRADFEANGRKSKLLRAANPETIALGLQDNPLYQASPEEIEERAMYFETCADNEWWQAPAVVADYVKWDKEGAVWQSRNFKESQLSMGMENPAPQEELDQRATWFESNYWKTPEAIADYQNNGNKGSLWKAGRDGTTPAPAHEIAHREAWFKKNFTVDKDEETRRKNWYLQQLTDEETAMRRNWIVKKAGEGKRIHPDEMKDLLAQINDGTSPSDEQVERVMEAVRAIRAERTGDDDVEIGEDGITQEEFVTAVANTDFYVSATDEERLRAEQEALDALQREEMERQDEVAGHLAMEAQEELDNAGFEEHEEIDEDDEAAFLDEMDEADLENRVNDDDGDVDEGAWEEFLQQNDEEEEEYTEDQLAELQREEEERMAAEAAQAEAEAAAWNDEEIGGDEGEDDAVENPADLDEDAREGLEAVVNEDWDNQEDWEEELEEEEEIDEMMEEEKGQPMQWKLPLPEVVNPQYLKAYFTVIKYTPSHSFLGGKQKRVWVVDHFTRCFYNLEKSGKIKKEHAANKLLQLERNIVDSNRLRLMFFDASHSYELQFFNARERERFFETASAIRPSIRVYAPDLTNQDANVEACTTTIDGVGANSVSVVCSNAAGKPVKRELTGECKVNASKLLTEPLTVWTGTFNLSGQRPPRNKAELAAWLPKDKHDIYAIAVQEASYRKEENEWFDYVQAYLGREYLTLASMNLWDTLLIVLTRKKHLLKITNVEGSTKATIHKAVCGPKGGIGISLRYLETSMCFVTCHLSSRIERTAMRNTNLEEIIDNLQLGIRETDLYNQFNHVFFFGDFNYRTEVDVPTAENMIQNEAYSELLAYDQFSKQREEGLLYGFEESPITFAPTYRLQPGTGKYMAEKGNASSYCDRVLTRSMTNTWVKCTSYKSVPQLTFSEHSPVAATFIVRCVRPVLSCFAKQQNPQPTFRFKQIKVTGNSVVISKPRLMVCSPFFGNNKPLESRISKNANPVWNAAELPPFEAVSQIQPLLESGHIVFIIREGAEKREEKGHRGSANLPLFGRVIGQENTEQDFEIDLINHGRKIGTVSGVFTWVASK